MRSWVWFCLSWFSIHMTAISQAEHIPSCSPVDLPAFSSTTLSIPILQKKGHRIIQYLYQHYGLTKCTICSHEGAKRACKTNLTPRFPSKVHTPTCEQIFFGCACLNTDQLDNRERQLDCQVSFCCNCTGNCISNKWKCSYTVECSPLLTANPWLSARTAPLQICIVG